MQEDRIKVLLSDAIDKLRRTSDYDIKIATEMSNNLNWITTLATLFFGFMINVSIADFCYKNGLIFIYKLCFIFLISILIIYKIVLKRYVLTKTDILNTLDTHYVELKDNPLILKSKLTKKHDFFVNFINSLRNGEFLPYGNEERKIHLDKRYKDLKQLGWIIKWSYTVAIGLFVINFLISIIFIMKK